MKSSLEKDGFENIHNYLSPAPFGVERDTILTNEKHIRPKESKYVINNSFRPKASCLPIFND
jgi:hypothetical protein